MWIQIITSARFASCVLAQILDLLGRTNDVYPNFRWSLLFESRAPPWVGAFRRETAREMFHDSSICIYVYIYIYIYIYIFMHI